MAQSSSQSALLSLPGHCTGDVWHNAGAQILSQCYGNVYPYNFTILLALQSKGSNADDNARRQAVNFDYYRAIGAQCLLVKMDVGAEDLGNLISGISRTSLTLYERLSVHQQQYSTSNFDEIWPKLQTISPSEAEEVREGHESFPAMFFPPLHYYVATTVLCSYLSLRVPLAERKSRLESLSRGLRGPIDPTGPLGLEVQRKIQELKSRIAIQRAANDFETAQAVLFNYRRGFMNPNQDANDGIFQHVCQLAREHGFVVIRVAMGLSSADVLPSDFDLFDVTFSQADILDKRYTSSFWAEVAQLPEVFGFVGSRTGSLDIAAFNGVNCLEWDEPVFEVVAGTAQASWNCKYSKEHLEYQVPQYLRMLQQCSIMSVVLLDPQSFENETGSCTKLMDTGLQSWLSGDRDVFPEIPRTQAAVSRSGY
jgi:hypothetical protein